jgi:hypothetical protein
VAQSSGVPRALPELPFRGMGFGGDIALTALDREGLIDAVAIPVDDDDLRAVFARQSADDLPSEEPAVPMPVASD